MKHPFVHTADRPGQWFYYFSNEEYCVPFHVWMISHICKYFQYNVIFKLHINMIGGL